MGKPVDVGQHAVLERKLLLHSAVGAEVQIRVQNFRNGVYKNGYLHHGIFRCNLISNILNRVTGLKISRKNSCLENLQGL
jgi:predicted secreted Zn-dependent protease